MRILLVSQMYPGATDPDLGVFVRELEEQLAARGHQVERAVLDRRGVGKQKYLRLARATAAASRRFHPDVVYAHFLFPTGLIGALAGHAPLVVTAHGRDVRNVGWIPGIRAATRLVARRAASIIAVSDYLRRELEAKVPEARGKTEVVDSGVDLERFTVQPAPLGATRYLCIASLIQRKNVLRLASAFERLGEGTLSFVGDGPLRPQLEGRPGIELVGRVPYDRIPAEIAAAHVVVQPSLIEPFGQAVLEAMAVGRAVVATRIGGPPEFVPPDAGVLVDPADEDALVEALRSAAALPCPNQAARAAAEEHDVRRQAEKIEAILERAARGPRA
ncbi:MAG: glycosyltransferase [Actinobacteria bacterium]|nr:glycosyltransferase [Actinomycetota bacterium]